MRGKTINAAFERYCNQNTFIMLNYESWFIRKSAEIIVNSGFSSRNLPEVPREGEGDESVKYEYVIVNEGT